eukprot:3582051-Lingulodinium_polyedra.AAC.1
MTRHGHAQAWRISKGFQQTLECPVSLGDATAKTLALARAARMDYLYEMDGEGKGCSPPTT